MRLRRIVFARRDLRPMPGELLQALHDRPRGHLLINKIIQPRPAGAPAGQFIFDPGDASAVPERLVDAMDGFQRNGRVAGDMQRLAAQAIGPAAVMARPEYEEDANGREYPGQDFIDDDALRPV